MYFRKSIGNKSRDVSNLQDIGKNILKNLDIKPIRMYDPKIF